jgi:hypothetical protein
MVATAIALARSTPVSQKACLEERFSYSRHCARRRARNDERRAAESPVCGHAIAFHWKTDVEQENDASCI